MNYTVHGIPQARILEWGTSLFPEDLPNPEVEPRSPALQAGSLPAEPQGKPKNIGVGSLFLGEGYGNPLSYSCLENPMERGAWWAAVHGVTQSQIRLKRLSSSSSSLSLLEQIFPTQEFTRDSYIAGRFFTNWLSGKPKEALDTGT